MLFVITSTNHLFFDHFQIDSDFCKFLFRKYAKTGVTCDVMLFVITSTNLPSNSEVHASWINLRTIFCLIDIIHTGIWSIVEIVILPILTMLYIAWFYKKSRYQFDFCLIETLKKAKKRELYWGIKKRLKPLKPDAFYTRSYLTWMSHKHFPFPTPMERALSLSSLGSSVKDLALGLGFGTWFRV